ncbi:MAG: T9SS type A sorting domain-containing protein, partial [Candidatus Marinimicrobia bacterium]|nr:T9SS type A sorting domain-containing protein [Candidatus Neomarinimicrobiota bacterium]
TIIDGQQTGSVFNSQLDQGPTLVLEDLAITGGLAGNGGGLYLNGAEVTILNCDIYGNNASDNGGGIYAEHCSQIHIENTIISDNSADNQSGGGCYFLESNVDVYNSTFYINQAVNQYGGGMFIYNTNQDVVYIINIWNSTFDNNIAYGSGGLSITSGAYDLSGFECNVNNTTIVNNTSFTSAGITLWGQNTHANINECVIIDNSSESYVAGLHFNGGASGNINRCTIAGNIAGTGDDNTGNGAGTSVWNESSAIYSNCTIVNNSGDYGSGISVGSNAYAELVNCILWNNSPEQISVERYNDLVGEINISYTDLMGGVGGINILDNSFIITVGEGIIDTDPQIVDPENYNFTIATTSPCIDVGHPDLDGDGYSWETDPDDQDPDGTRMDLGAFYYYQTGGNDYQVIWETTFGDTAGDYGLAADACVDGGFIIAGLTHSYGAVGGDALLIKTDSMGNEEWLTTLGGDSSDYCFSVKQTNDQGFILTGSTISTGAGGGDVWLIKTDPNGSEEWSKTFGGTGYERGYSVALTHDGGFIISGITDSFGSGDTDLWLIKTDSYGNEEWNRTFGQDASADVGYCVQPYYADGYVVVGHSDTLGNGGGDLWLIKTDNDGNEVWSRTFGGTDYDDGYSVKVTSDSGFVMAGRTYISDGNSDAWIIKADSEGNEEWINYYGGDEYDRAYSIIETQDDGYLFTGYSSSYGDGDSDAWLVKTDSQGNEELNQTYGGSGSDNGRSVLQTSMGDYVVAGYSTSFGNGSADFYLLKVSGTHTPSSVIHVAIWGNDNSGDGSEGNPFATIQHGIDVANDGDIVLVQPGTYHENVIINNKSIIVASQFLLNQDISNINNTIIDGENTGRVITIINDGGYSNLTVAGFTIINGDSPSNNDPWAGHGGGILVDGLTAKLNNLILHSNVDSLGAGIAIINADSVMIDNVIIHDNTATFYGGGIYSVGCNQLYLNGVTINNNTAEEGGGLYFINSEIAYIRNCLIYRNSAEIGGGIEVSQSNIDIVNTTICNNSANSYGGAFLTSGEIILHSVNSIVWFNQPDFLYSQGGQYDLFMEYSDIQGGTDQIIVQDSNGSINWLDGNLVSFPEFIDPEYDNYRLSQSSPCIDTGHPDLDGDGNNWVSDPDDQDPDGTRMDMGAYYYHQDTTGSQVTTASLNPGSNSWLAQADTIWIEFSQPVHQDIVANYCQLTSAHFGDFAYEVGQGSNQRCFIVPTNSYPFMDLILLNFSEGMQDDLGNPVDISTISDSEFYTSMPADFNGDGTVDYQDFSTFTDLWYSGDEQYINQFDLFPRFGELPNIVVTPDGKFGYDELMTLVYLWNHTHLQLQSLSRVEHAGTAMKPELIVQGPTLSCELPPGTMSGQILIDYNSALVRINGSSQTSPEKRLILNKTADSVGFMITEFLDFKSADVPAITFNLEAQTRRDYRIVVSFTFLDNDGVVISSGQQGLEIVAIPNQFALHQNYPNPFNPVTTIDYDLPDDGLVKLTIIDILGRQVIQLTNEYQTAGYKSVRWNGRSTMGKTVSTGVYFYSLESGKYSAIRKLIILMESELVRNRYYFQTLL